MFEQIQSIHVQKENGNEKTTPRQLATIAAGIHDRPSHSLHINPSNSVSSSLNMI